MPYTSIGAQEFAELPDLDDWRWVLHAIVAEFRLASFSDAGALAAEIARAADAVDHHPDLDVRYPGVVRVTLTTHVADGPTTADVDLARTVSSLARAAGAGTHGPAGQGVEIAIDTVDPDRIRPFWAAVLGYRDAGGVLVDPLRIGPPVWFQTVDEARLERGRVHIDVSVPHDLAEARVRAAVAAGGRLVTDRFARAWWVLADADGNEACVSTWQDR